jgi:hypothetical protein
MTHTPTSGTYPEPNKSSPQTSICPRLGHALSEQWYHTSDPLALYTLQPTTNKLCCWTVIWFHLRKKHLVSNRQFSFFSPVKRYNPLLDQRNPLPIWSPVPPLNVNYTWLIFLKLFSVTLNKGCTNFPKFRSHLTILDPRGVTRNKFHIEDHQILGIKLKNSIATATWRPWFVHPCPNLRRLLTLHSPNLMSIFCYACRYK